jgi:hypothetical protein
MCRLFALHRGDNRALIERDSHGALSMRADPRGDDPMVGIASELMDADPGRQDVGVGELILWVPSSSSTARRS